MTKITPVELTEAQQKIMELLRKEKWTTPTKAGLHVGHSYYGACSVGHSSLMPLVYMGLVRKEGFGRDVKYWIN